MTDRAAALTEFLRNSDWGDARRSPLAGDASARRYERLARPGARAVLMDADPAKGESIDSFIRIATYLADRGFSAPRIFATDTAQGFMILEDLGDDLFARHAAQHPKSEVALYEAAIDVLAALHQIAPPDVPRYQPRMAELAALAWDWYLPATTGQHGDASALRTTLDTLLTRNCQGDEVLILRDYHAENLLWLPDRAGHARVGLLDFQDAMLGHPSYDLISLTEDARRDVPPALRDALLARYIDTTGQDADTFRTAAAITAAQRNLRILGVFARLALRDGKMAYIDLIPRTWGHLQHDLRHPALAELRDIVLTALPPPTPEILNRLRAACTTTLTP